MDPHTFESLQENMKKNILEVKSIINIPSVLEPSDGATYDRGVYLFQSVIKSLIAIGNDIIIENDFRAPLNPADVFISLAEQKLISTSIVPALKKAAIAMPRISSSTKPEIMQMMTECISNFSQCLNSYSEYFASKRDGV